MIVVYSGVLVVVGCDEARERGQVSGFRLRRSVGPCSFGPHPGKILVCRKDSGLGSGFGSGFREQASGCNALCLRFRVMV